MPIRVEIDGLTAYAGGRTEVFQNLPPNCTDENYAPELNCFVMKMD